MTRSIRVDYVHVDKKTVFKSKRRLNFYCFLQQKASTLTVVPNTVQDFENLSLNPSSPFVPNEPFLHPLKTSENFTVF